MLARLRPTAPFARDAILVGDPGRALLLAQELLADPKMGNHARGLWGYTGSTAAGGRLSIQSTGMGGPSAAIVLADLAELGVRRAVRVGTSSGRREGVVPGELIVVGAALAEGGSAVSIGVDPGGAVRPDAELTDRLRRELGAVSTATVASFDSLPPKPDGRGEAAAADMQTATILGRGGALTMSVAAVLIVETGTSGERISEQDLEICAKRAGRAALAVLSA